MQGAREGFSRYPFYLQAAGSSGPICADHSRSREARRAGTRDGVELSLRPFLLRPEGCCRLSPQHLAALSLSLVPGSGLCTDPESLLPTGGCGCREVLSWRASVGLGHGGQSANGFRASSCVYSAPSAPQSPYRVLKVLRLLLRGPLALARCEPRQQGRSRAEPCRSGERAEWLRCCSVRERARRPLARKPTSRPRHRLCCSSESSESSGF